MMRKTERDIAIYMQTLKGVFRDSTDFSFVIFDIDLEWLLTSSGSQLSLWTTSEVAQVQLIHRSGVPSVGIVSL